MYSFTKETITKILQNGNNNECYTFINEAINDEAWLNCFANGEHIELFKERFISKFATLDKEHDSYRAFLWDICKIYTNPLLATNTGTVYASFAKIFDTSDGKKITYSFVDSKEEFDYYDYRKTAFYSDLAMGTGISPDAFFKDIILNKFLYKPNTRIILNFLAPQTAQELPNPIIQLIDISNIEYIKEYSNGVECIIFSFPKDSEKQSNHISEKRFIAIDSISFYEFEFNGTITNFVEKPHNLGYCPVKSLPLADKYASHSIIKKSPIQDSINDIFDYNILYNQYKEDCFKVLTPSNFDLVTDCDEMYEGVTCENGFHNYFDKITNLARTSKCRKCEQRRKNTYKFGKRTELKLNDILSYSGRLNPMDIIQKGHGIIETDTKTLEYTEQKLERLIKSIERSIIGNGFNFSQSKESFNAYQIDASLDDKRNQLAILSNKIETIREWCETGLAGARYLSFVYMSVSYGRQYFLQSDTEIIEQLQKYKSAGNDSIFVKELKKELLNNKYKNDKKMLEYYQVLLCVLPFQSLTTIEVITNKQILVPLNDNEALINYTIKLNEESLTERFFLFYHDHIQNLKWGSEAKIQACKNWFSKQAQELINKSKILNNIKNGSQETDGQSIANGDFNTNDTVASANSTAEKDV